MKAKTLKQISVVTSLEAEEAVLELLARVFQRAAGVYTNEETKITIASVYCEKKSVWTTAKKTAINTGLKIIKASGLDIGTGKILVQTITKENWAESWKRHFKPLEIGTRLLIKPSWIKRRPKKNQAVVVLDPGLSFGTGNHPTTSFCLGEVVRCRREDQAQSFWDVGTGSGILSIAAAKLGYKPIRALDFDPEAVRVARENARQNKVLKQIQIARQDITKLPKPSREKYDVVCANLISTLLLAEKAMILNRLHPKGTLVLAGILKEEFSQVQRAYVNAGLKLVSTRVEGEWQSGAFVRN